MYKKYILLGLLFLTSYALTAQYQTDTVSVNTKQGNSWFDWLYTGTDEVLEMTIETDVRDLVRKKLREEYQKAKLSVRNADGEMFEQELRIRARGNRRKEVCFYPPLKLKFKKTDLEAAGLSKSDDFKLVTQCRDTKICEYYTAKEFLIYKLYSLVSPYYFQAQLVRISFIDSNGKGKTREMLGFIIEPENEMAKRLDAELIERGTMRSTFLSNEPHQIMALFQYMIGNTDWAVGNSHNLKFLKVAQYDRLTPVPYDFDYSGLVNTDYAVPFHTLPIKSVTERLYRGVECTTSEIPPLVEYFRSRKSAIMNYVEQYPHLNDLTKTEVTRYLEDFFEFLESERRVQDVLGSR